jgi:hypothetical protein
MNLRKEFMMRKILLLMFSVSVLFGQSAFDDGGFSFDSEEAAVPSLSWNGFMEFEPRFFQHNNAPAEWELIQALDLSFAYEKEFYTVKGTFKADDDSLTALLDELTASVFLGRLQLHTGKQKVVWGKGDQVHLVDWLNPDDYRDFIFPDYQRRRLGTEMLRLNYVVGPYSWNSSLELVWVPKFTPMRFAESALWRPAALNSLESLAPQLASSGFAIQYEEYEKLSDSQFAARFTNSFAGFDWGISYYNGRMRIPALEFIGPTIENPEAAGVNIIYNPVQVFGFEWSTAISKLNLRGELSRLLTDDTDGRKPHILNPKWGLLIGADASLPIHNLSVNIQYLRDFVTEEDPVYSTAYEQQLGTMLYQMGIDPALLGLASLDAYYENHFITGAISDSFFRDRLKPEIQWVMNVDGEDQMLTLKLDTELRESFHLIALYRQFSGDAGTVFGQYDKNDFASLRLEVRF